jgi:hypothetical protein
LNALKDFWDKWGEDIISGITKVFDGIKELFEALWTNFLEPIVTRGLEKLRELWDNHLKALIEQVLEFVGILATAALDIYNEFIQPVVKALIEIFGPAFAELFALIVDIMSSVLGAIADAARGIIQALGGIIDFVAGIFTGNWKRAWDGVKNIFQGAWEAIKGITKGALNVVIDYMNSFIKQLNKLSVGIPEGVPGVGGKRLGFNIPQIPKLAKGGIAYGPTLAMIGDNRNAGIDPEVISPLSKLESMIQSAVSTAVQTSQPNHASGDVVIKIGENEFARIAINAINKAQRRAGTTLLEV